MGGGVVFGPGSGYTVPGAYDNQRTADTAFFSGYVNRGRCYIRHDETTGSSTCDAALRRLYKVGILVYIILLGAPGAGKGTQANMLADKMKLVQVASGDLFRKALQEQTELGKKAKLYMDKGQLVPNEITIQMVLDRLSAPDVKGELGKKAKLYMDKGQLVPNEITIQMVLDRLSAPDVKGGAILDGFPRNLEQAKALDKALKEKSKAIDKVVNIKVTEEEVLNRLSGRWICRDCQAPYQEVDNPPKKKGVCDRCSGQLYQRDDDKPETIKKRLLVYQNETAPLIEYYKKAGKLVEVVSEGGPENVNKKMISALH